MERQEGRSAFKRAALSAVTLLAFILQGFLATSVALHATSSGGITTVECSIDGSRTGGSGDKNGKDHGLCCILACAAAAGAAFTSPSGTAAAFPHRLASSVQYRIGQALPSHQPLKHPFAARGPPALI
ncbi:MAG TPA: hypothetical protein VEK34_11670 [Methylocella sp.]|nr:hypothetical protein [Methylocella sp.]